MNAGTKRSSFRRHTLTITTPLQVSWRTSTRQSSPHNLDKLHADVLFLICQYLNWPEDLYAISLVSRNLNILVTPLLYRTITITPSPRATLALLDKLDSDEKVCSSVQTLVFDNFVRSLRPRIPHPDEFDSAREKDLTDLPGHCYDDRVGDPHRIRLRLYDVLPKLQNLQNLCVKRWNHILQGPLSASECYHYWNPKFGRKLALIRKLRPASSYKGPPAVMHGDQQPCPSDIVSLLLLRCPSIQKVSIIGSFPALRFSHPTTAFTNLTVLLIGERSANASLWNEILRHCKQLRVLGLLNVHFRFEKFLAGCEFPHLESIEWYGYAFSTISARRPVKAFAEFMQTHSKTLKCVALAPRLCQPRGFPFDGGMRFFNSSYDMLPNLETLRLQNWFMFSSDHDRWPHIESTQSRTLAEELYQFVLDRPKLVDLTITELPQDLATRLKAELGSQRKMKRLMVGDSLHASKSDHVPLESYSSTPRGWSVPGGMVRRRQAEWSLTRKQDYLREAWQSYAVMFEGLELAESGYRPWLLSSKCPRNWLDYLRR